VYQQIAANKRKTWIIMLFFVAMIAAIGWVYGQYASQPFITPYVIAGALAYALGSYLLGSRTALAVNGAQEIKKSDDPRLWRIVENLSITEGLPMPKVYIMDDPALNAFATGRNPEHASVCATSGLLQALTDDELRGVFAHEMGHVKNYDIRVSMIAFALVAAIGLMSDILLRLTWFSGDRRNSNQFILVLGIVAAIVAPLVAALIQLAISRRREYLADATGALATRYPEGLASALEKIANSSSVVRKQSSSTAHLFFANPLRGGLLASLFSTHPPIEERIRRLREMGSHA
jgi:heat shock protein HtpX